jgi:Cd2+/Zn2+-exporting ATPase
MADNGINDSPSLVAVSIGFLLGGADADTAKEAADIVVVNNDLCRIPEAIRLSRMNSMTPPRNIAIALEIKAVFSC